MKIYHNQSSINKSNEDSPQESVSLIRIKKVLIQEPRGNFLLNTNTNFKVYLNLSVQQV